MVEINGIDANAAFQEALWKMKVFGKIEQTRNGSAITIQEPALLTIDNPRLRVLTCPHRDANPFFHVMETVWMLAGHKDAKWPAQFNKNYTNYAEDDGNVNAAYGYRWRWGFGVNQLFKIGNMLRENPSTRQAVIAMWDPVNDTVGRRDNACNTHIYFRVVGEKLNCLVCNRSNDLVWGMLGANVVHLTYLHEFMAAYAGIELGKYQVVSNNLHIYKNHWYLIDAVAHAPLPSVRDTYHLEYADGLLHACEEFIDNNVMEHPWIVDVVMPMWHAWWSHKNNDRESVDVFVSRIQAEDWRIACQEWLERRYA